MEKIKNNSVNFRWIVRDTNGIVGYIFVICIDTTETDDFYLLYKSLQLEGLECLDISKDKEYQALFKTEKGVAIYIKSHSEFDSDFSVGFDPGLTSLNAFRKIKHCIEDICKKRFILDGNALEQLKEFKLLYSKQGIDWETIKLLMPELIDFDILFEEVKIRLKNQNCKDS